MLLRPDITARYTYFPSASYVPDLIGRDPKVETFFELVSKLL
jgi:hypothetical protein